MPSQDSACSAHDPDPVLTKQLLEEALAGDRDSEQRLFQSLRDVLVEEAARHRLMGLVRRFAHVEDVVQEVWLRCYASGGLRDFEDRGRGSLRAFLRVLLERTLIDMVRRARSEKRGGLVRRVSLQDGSDTSPLGADVPSPDPTPTSDARAAELQALCAKVLTPRERDIWQLAEVDGLDSNAIAERLGITAPAARSLLRRARHRLVHTLRSQQPGSSA